MDRFAAAAARAERAERYRAHVPLTSPGPGEQYAFSVDLDACSGCKSCVTACHQLNGLDVDEAWRDVGRLDSSVAESPASWYVTTACHHCVEPSCLTGCPVSAYEKDPITGIVRHLDDQCFGCQYCILTCPYEVPRFRPERGIVRKCDLCRQRLAENEPPACVEACPNEAISVQIVDRDEARLRADQGEFLPASPDPRHSRPTTLFRSTRALADAVAPPRELTPEHEHLPLVGLLLASQLSVGTLAFDVFAGHEPARGIVALAFAIAGGASATAHLGRPHLAWRAWIGLRTSWLSRESVLFAAYTGLLACRWWMGPIGPLDAVALTTGVATVLASAMVYASTPRPHWRWSHTIPRFAVSAALLGSAVELAIFGSDPAIAWTVASLALVGLALDVRPLLGSRPTDHPTPRARTLREVARLLTGPLRTRTWIAAAIGAAAVGTAVLAATDDSPSLELARLLCAALVAAFELVSRRLWFAAALPVRMPGVVRR